MPNTQRNQDGKATSSTTTTTKTPKTRPSLPYILSFDDILDILPPPPSTSASTTSSAPASISLPLLPEASDLHLLQQLGFATQAAFDAYLRPLVVRTLMKIQPLEVRQQFAREWESGRLSEKSQEVVDRLVDEVVKTMDIPGMQRRMQRVREEVGRDAEGGVKGKGK
jgi:hypothetical protein